VEDWFQRTNSFAKREGLKLEHYVVSSGIRAMIEGSPVSKNFTRVFASSFAYDSDGEAVWPSVAINYTTKTQFLFRINKGIQNTWDNEAINRWIPMTERPLPFERIIFIGDGDTDIPSMKMVRFQGGVAIAVFDPQKWSQSSHQNKMGRLIAEDRVNYVAPADYRPGQQLDVTVRGVLGRIAREAGFRPEQG
jgi:haloacid dehalogenase-like hydrolase